MFVDAFRSAQEELAGLIQRITGPAAVAERVVLDALPATSDGLVREAHDVERVDDERDLAEQTLSVTALRYPSWGSTDTTSIVARHHAG